jgi:hypothetical protein
VLFRSLAYVLALVAAVACKKDSPRPPYTYNVELGLRGTEGISIANVHLRAGGRDLGAIDKPLTIPADLWLGDPASKLEITIPTSCGTTVVAVASDDVTKEATARVSTATPVYWVLTPVGVEIMSLYLDNKLGTTAATVKIGEQNVALAAAEAREIRIALGPCAHGRRVEIAGKHVGDIGRRRDGGVVLISVLGDQCYMSGYELYRIVGDDGKLSRFDPDPRLPDATVYRLAGHMDVVPRVDFFTYAAMPARATVTTSEDRQRSILEPISCKVAAAYQAAQAKRAN